MTTPDYQQRTYEGRTTTIDHIGGGVYVVTLSFGPFGPAQWWKSCRSITDAESFARKHSWPIPSDELTAKVG